MLDPLTPTVGINDAVELLKSLVGLPSTAVRRTCGMFFGREQGRACGARPNLDQVRGDESNWLMFCCPAPETSPTDPACPHTIICTTNPHVPGENGCGACLLCQACICIPVNASDTFTFPPQPPTPTTPSQSTVTGCIHQFCPGGCTACLNPNGCNHRCVCPTVTPPEDTTTTTTTPSDTISSNTISSDTPPTGTIDVPTPPSGETIAPPGQENAPVVQPCAWGPCPNNDEVCLSCGYCHQCDWEIFGAIRCTRCNWSTDCLAAYLQGWSAANSLCTACANATGGAGGNAPSGMSSGTCVRQGGSCSSGVCPGCSFCANCSWILYGHVSCAGCFNCGDCLSKAGRDWNRSAGTVRCSGC
jgi:hypothetical protein